MYIQKTMMNKIANTFYDKEISILEKNTIIDDEGGVNSKGYTILNTFKGNVNFSNCKEIQKEYGLDYGIDISITTNIDTVIAIDDIISYNSIIYKVTDVLASDSHIQIIASKWRQ